MCGDPVAREQVPRLLSDLGVRIGLTFREGWAEKNRKVRRLQGGIIAFGNRPLPCVLRNGAGRPIVGGLAPEAGDHAHDDGCDRGHHDAHPDKARRRAGDKKTLSNGTGKPTGARGGPRGATPHSLVESKPPRQPPETGRLSKVSRGDTRRANYNRGPFDIATLAIFPEYLEFEGQEVLQLVVEGAAGRTAT